MKMLRRRAGVVLISMVVASTGLVVLGAAPLSAAGPLAYTVVFVDGGGCRIATVDVSTGATALLSAPADGDACVRDITVAPDGTIWGIDEIDGDLEAVLVQFNPATGAIIGGGVITGDFTESGLAAGGIAFGVNDVMYVHMVTDETGCDDLFVCLYTVDPTTRVATFVGNSGQVETPMFFLTADCGGSMVTSEDVLELPNSADTPPGASPESDPRPQVSPPEGWPDLGAQNGLISQQLGNVNPSTGAVTRGAVLPELFDVLGLEFDRATGVLYVIGLELTPAPPIAPAQVFDDIGVYTLDPATGVTTRVADFDEEAAGFPQGLAIAGTCVANLVVAFTG